MLYGTCYQQQSGVQFPIFLSDLNRILNSSKEFHENPRYQISRKFWGSSMILEDGRAAANWTLFATIRTRTWKRREFSLNLRAGRPPTVVMIPDAV